MKEHIIYDSYNDTTEDPDGLFFQDECMNLDKELDGRIIAIADLGLWNGRRSAYKVGGHNLNDIMDIGNHDYIRVYFDGYNIRKTSIHHDGTNHILFREVREDRNIDNLTNLLYNGDYIPKNMINNYTRSLGRYVKDIYGW